MPKRRPRDVNRVHVGFFAAITARETLCILATGFGHAKQPQEGTFSCCKTRLQRGDETMGWIRGDGFALLKHVTS